MVIKLYKWDVSPVSRAAMMACEVFNVPAEHIYVSLPDGEHKKPDFVKMNPLHTLPVLDDNGLIIHDSHAILIYLAEVYGKNDSFYPKDPKQRALVNQKLFFESSVLFPRMRNITNRLLLEGLRDIPQQSLDEVDEAYAFTEEFLSRTKYLAGDNLTIADIAAYATITSLMLFLDLDAQKYPKTHAWLKDLERQPWVQKQNTKGMEIAKQMIGSLLA